MKRIATKTATKGKKSVILDVFSNNNVLSFADTSCNYYKIIHIQDYDEAICRFYEWTLQMHSIKTKTTLYQ